MFRAQATDPDGGLIVGYEWRSDVDGPLGSEATFTLPAARLQSGIHAITVRALDDEGDWSAPRSVTLEISDRHRFWLPLAIRK